ncbi:hypothetical protein GOV14_06715 [Candidatus Pacearchaeota archaeon]|nr:hypothetical protein [Candidatus Pacearchaeota archaeon]
MVVRIKKKKKAPGMRGTNSHGGGARGKRRKSGHHGGGGMSGSGKRADHKKSLVIKLYGNKYFGKKGIVGKKTARDKRQAMDLKEIQRDLRSILKKFGVKGKKDEIILKDYTILGEGELKQKLTITAKRFSKSAKQKIEKAGGKWIMTQAQKTISEAPESIKKVKDSEQK